jgi:hypothetical protein
MKPKDRVESRYLDDTHVTQSEDVVETIVECLEVPDGSAIGLVADQIERLICSQELVQHIPQIGLLLANTNIHFVITACCIDRKSVQRITNGMVPVLELKLALRFS